MLVFGGAVGSAAVRSPGCSLKKLTHEQKRWKLLPFLNYYCSEEINFPLYQL